MNIVRALALLTVIPLVVIPIAGCISLAPNASAPMGLRENDGRIEILVCEAIDVAEVGIEYRIDRNEGELIELYRGPADLTLAGGDVVPLSSVLPSSTREVSLVGLGLSDQSRFGISLVDANDGLKNQVSVFLFRDGLPTGEQWLSPTGSYSADPCGP